MRTVTESIYPYVGEYFLYEGTFHIPENFSFQVDGNTIKVTQNHQFKIGDYVHVFHEDFLGNCRIVVGQVADTMENCLVLEGYCTLGDITFHAENLVVSTIASKFAEDYEIMWYKNAIEEYKTNNKKLIKKLCTR